MKKKSGLSLIEFAAKKIQTVGPVCLHVCFYLFCP